MEIRTKFNVNDTVWYITLRFVLGYIVEKGKVIDIRTYNSKDKKEIRYFLGKGYVKEQDCFATQAEAQAECDRRNNENRNTF